MRPFIKRGSSAVTPAALSFISTTHAHHRPHRGRRITNHADSSRIFGNSSAQAPRGFPYLRPLSPTGDNHSSLDEEWSAARPGEQYQAIGYELQLDDDMHVPSVCAVTYVHVSAMPPLRAPHKPILPGTP
jgi:hypothetical protein